MTIQMHWLETHVGSLDKCVELSNDYFWNLVIFEGSDHKWYVKSGESTIFTADNRESLDAFLYGMGMAYAGIPEHLFEKLISDSRDLFI